MKKQVFFVLILFLAGTGIYFLQQNPRFSLKQTPVNEITLNKDSKTGTLTRVQDTQFYDLTFANVDYASPYMFYHRNDAFELWNRGIQNDIKSASLLQLQPNGSRLTLNFAPVTLPNVEEGYTLISQATSDEHEYMFYYKAEVCGDGCNEATSEVDIYQRSGGDWNKLSTRLPFKTPDFLNFSPFIHNNYLYVIHIWSDRENKNEQSNPVYRAQILQNGELAEWQELNPIPNLETNAYGVSKSLVVDGNVILIPFSFTKFYNGSIGQDGNISIWDSIELPFHRYIFTHNDQIHFITNEVSEDKTKVTNKIGKVTLVEGTAEVDYYPETSALMDLSNHSFDSWNYYHNGAVYTILEARNFDTQEQRFVLEVQGME